MAKRERGFTLIELLVVVAIIGILSGIAFVSISGARESAYDTQIRSELSQIRSNAEQWYYDTAGGNGSYNNYDTAPGWENIMNEIPGCAQAILNETPDAHGEDVITGEEHLQYQLTIQDTESPQRYAAWAPLCGTTIGDGADEERVYYCVDSDGTAGEFVVPTDTTQPRCADIFDSTAQEYTP